MSTPKDSRSSSDAPTSRAIGDADAQRIATLIDRLAHLCVDIVAERCDPVALHQMAGEMRTCFLARLD